MEEKQNNKNADVGTQSQGDIKTLYDRYCDCRDQELDRFWKNSTYVWIFLAVCFAAFGQVILAYLGLKEESSDDVKPLFNLKKTYETLLSIISFIGLLCSFIWVWMARGMKAWYEVFEMAIWNMENDNALKMPEKNKYKIENFWRIKDSRFVWQKALFGAESNSPSKIVILIGRLLCFVWFFAFMWALMSVFNILPFANTLESAGWFFLFFGVAFIFIYFCHFFIQGSVLLSDGEAEVKKHIETKIKKIISTKINGFNEQESYQFYTQNVFKNVEEKINKCIVFFADKLNVKLEQHLQKTIYDNIIAKIEHLNDYGIIEEVVSQLKDEKIATISIQSTIIRYLWCRTFMIDIKGMKKQMDIKDFKCLEGNEDSKYFIIKTVTNVNGNMIKIRCRAKNWWSDLLNKDRYNLHTEDAKV